MEIRNTSRELVDALLPVRDRESHKGDFGRILLLCGSVGYTGAAALAGIIREAVRHRTERKTGNFFIRHPPHFLCGVSGTGRRRRRRPPQR